MDAPQIEKSAAMRFLSHPVVSVISAVASIVSLPLAFYFYFASIRSPDLTFYFHPVRSTIVSPGAPTTLTVSYGGKELKGSILVFQCALWNAGGASIKREDILERIYLSVEKGVRVLEVTERRKSRESIGFSIDSTRLDTGEVGFDWKILEQNDGAAIQILYEGPPDAKFAFHGAVVGQHSLRLTEESRIKPPDEELKRIHRIDHVLSYAALVLGILMLGYGIYARSRSSERGAPIMFVIQGLVMVGIAGYEFYKLWWKSTPFDF